MEKNKQSINNKKNEQDKKSEKAEKIAGANYENKIA